MEGRLVGVIVLALSLAACSAAPPPAVGTAVRVPADTTTTGVVTRTVPTPPSIDRYCVWPTTTTHPPNQVPRPGPPSRPRCVTPPTTPPPPPTTLLQGAVTLTRSDNGRRFAVRVGTVVTVQLTPDTTSEDGPVQSGNRLVVPVISSTTGPDGQSLTVLRAVAPGDADLVGPDVIYRRPPPSVCPYPVCAGLRPVDWSAAISVFS